MTFPRSSCCVRSVPSGFTFLVLPLLLLALVLFLFLLALLLALSPRTRLVSFFMRSSLRLPLRLPLRLLLPPLLCLPARLHLPLLLVLLVLLLLPFVLIAFAVWPCRLLLRVMSLSLLSLQQPLGPLLLSSLPSISKMCSFLLLGVLVSALWLLRVLWFSLVLVWFGFWLLFIVRFSWFRFPSFTAEGKGLGGGWGLSLSCSLPLRHSVRSRWSLFVWLSGP